jgi:hypothetical protein
MMVSRAAANTVRLPFLFWVRTRQRYRYDCSQAHEASARDPKIDPGNSAVDKRGRGSTSGRARTTSHATADAALRLLGAQDPGAAAAGTACGRPGVGWGEGVDRPSWPCDLAGSNRVTAKRGRAGHSNRNPDTWVRGYDSRQCPRMPRFGSASWKSCLSPSRADALPGDPARITPRANRQSQY